VPRAAPLKMGDAARANISKSRASLNDQTVASCPHHRRVATHWVFTLMERISERERPAALSGRATRGKHMKTEPLSEGMQVSPLAKTHRHVPAAAHRYLVCQQAADMLLKRNTQCSKKPPTVVPAGLEAGYELHSSAAPVLN